MVYFIGILMSKFLKRDGIVFFLLMLLAIILSIILKNENFFDIANYHYYNPWALLNGRIGYDIAPASINSFLNPLLDLPRYLTIVYLNEHINWFYAINGLWFGWLLFVFYKILLLLFAKSNVVEVIIALAVAITGRMTLFQVGACTNDIAIAFIDLWGLYFLFKEIKKGPQKQNVSGFIWAGLILGAGLGLKTTSVTVCVAAGLSLLIGFKWLAKPIMFISLFALSGLVGYLLTNGWWMYKMWSLYDNPFFPFLNIIFKSEYFSISSPSTDNFIPSWKQLPFCPYLATIGDVCNAEGVDFDYRLPIAYTIGIGWIIYLLFSRKISYHYKNNRLFFFFYLFLVIDYLLWAKLLGVQHYFVVIEIFLSVLLVHTLSYWYYSKKFRSVFYLISYTLLIILVSVPFVASSFGNLRGANKVIDVEPIRLPAHTLVKMYNLPLGGILPEIAKYNDDFIGVGYWQYIDVVPNLETTITENKKFKQMREVIEQQYDNQILLFRLSSNFKQAKVIYENLQKELIGKKCRVLKNSFAPIFGQQIYICIPKNWDELR